jgi:LytS/YehU family sensor histidine kinase
LGYTVTAMPWTAQKAGLLFFYIGTEPDSVEQAKAGFEKIVEELRQAPLPEAMLEARCPRFILYPLVENAIMHGAKGEGEIRLELSAWADGRIRICVWDTGTVLQEQEICVLMENIQSQNRKGIGLSYVHNAVTNFFGEEGTLRLYAEGGGNVFEILIPYTVET